MERRDELRTYPGRVVPVGEFVTDVETDLAGATLIVAVADGYKAAELQDCSPWPLELVRSGSGPDGSAAVRAFQRAILTRAVRTASNLSLASAIKESTLRRDGNGNPAVDSARSRGRIDVLSAAVLAIGGGGALALRRHRWPSTPLSLAACTPDLASPRYRVRPSDDPPYTLVTPCGRVPYAGAHGLIRQNIDTVKEMTHRGCYDTHATPSNPGVNAAFQTR